MEQFQMEQRHTAKRGAGGANGRVLESTRRLSNK